MKRLVINRQDRKDRKEDLNGFALIELLVTIAVIAVIAGLLFPALAGAKSKADSVRCLGNLRQIGIAVRVYAGDNEGRLPRITTEGPIRIGDAAQRSILEEELGAHVSGIRKVFKCAADEKKNPGTKRASYEWNTEVNGRLLHRIEDATGTWLARDLEGWHPKGRKNAVFADGHVGGEE